MASLTGRFTRTALRRGVIDGSRGWLYVGLASLALSAARKLLSEPETVYTTELRAGQGLQIRSV